MSSSKKSADDDELTVEEYLTKQCEAQIKRIMDHSEFLVEDIEINAEKKKQEIKESFEKQ
ncbi:cinnamyl alcohol dehydrogenase [Acrasis kona]|uniref:Cinnamyl alcohol dehydrogenase n=1 Tax=Acrasis kona TaxID=1008807 RepID=A0AAW2ZGX3_9EUKA